ncbi:TPA: fimbrial protein [Klebsiella quasipneumoniae subsp. similipneumoniae]
MNKMIIAAAISLAFSTSVFAADTGTITFTGAVTDTTCNVDIGGAGEVGNVSLPTVSAASLGTKTSVSGKTQFNITLSECAGASNSAKAFFEAGATVDSATGRLINTDTTGAKFVSLQLLDGSTDSVINVGDYSQISNNTGYVDVSTGTATLPYFVQYYAEDAGVSAGAVESQVTYSISYK